MYPAILSNPIFFSLVHHLFPKTAGHPRCRFIDLVTLRSRHMGEVSRDYSLHRLTKICFQQVLSEMIVSTSGSPIERLVGCNPILSRPTLVIA